MERELLVRLLVGNDEASSAALTALRCGGVIVNSCGSLGQGNGLAPSMTCHPEAKVPDLRC
jgi:hypothetical protein